MLCLTQLGREIRHTRTRVPDAASPLGLLDTFEPYPKPCTPFIASKTLQNSSRSLLLLLLF
jgi:hypothetical protein